MDPNQKIQVEYQEAPNFSVTEASGVYGGLTGRGKVCMNFYVERVPFPQKSEIKISPEGKIDEKPIGMQQGMVGVRVMTNCVMMDMDVAKSFHEWLGAKIKEFETVVKIAAK